MGTSQSYGGPTGTPPLLPPWAEPFPPPNDDPPPDENPDPNLDPADQEDEAPSGDSVPQEETPSADDIQSISPPPNLWRAPKANMTRFVNTGERTYLSRAARGYVSAKGGRRGAASSAAAGRSTTARIGGILSSVVNQGITQTLQSIGLANLVGEPVTDVLAAICDRIAPAGASLEEAAARAAATEALADLYSQCDLDTEGIEGLESLDAGGVGRAVKVSVQAYIYERWLQELGKRIEANVTSPDDAIRLEREIKEYIREEVSLQFDEMDLLEVDWESAESQQIIEDIYETAYACLEDQE